MTMMGNAGLYLANPFAWYDDSIGWFLLLPKSARKTTTKRSDVEGKGDGGLVMSKPSDVPVVVMSVLAAASFWLGSQPLFMGSLAYHKLWLGEGQGYEGGLGGFLGGMFIWGVFFATPPAALFFGAVLIGLMLFRKRVTVNPVRLCVYSGILGLSWPLLFIVFTGIDGGMQRNEIPRPPSPSTKIVEENISQRAALAVNRAMNPGTQYYY